MQPEIEFMKRTSIILGLFTLGILMIAASPNNKIFSYKYHLDTLPNGLTVITVQTDYPNLVALYIDVRAGSRNEVEPGKSGFAHFFEHMMFRGTEKFPNEKYQEILKNAGASQNAYTDDDLTCYHTTFSKEDLETVLMLEADRFQNLKYSVEDFRTEAKAILGEYNKNSSNPINKLFEKLQEEAFQKHTYKHTTMGFIRDIEDMPNQYEYSLEFFKRYYRPEYTKMIIVGDLKYESTLSLVKKYWGDWQRGSFTADIPAEPPQAAPVVTHVEWPSPTLPYVVVGYKGPAFSDVAKDMATMDVISAVAFSESSPLYRKLVIDEQKVDQFFPYFSDHKDPYIVVVIARVNKADDFESVTQDILNTFGQMASTPVSTERLAAVKSNLKYRFALGLDNSEAIAATLARYLALGDSPETINNVYNVYDSITVEDVQKMAQKYFVENGKIIATLASAQ
jgi:zinc protease